MCGRDRVAARRGSRVSATGGRGAVEASGYAGRRRVDSRVLLEIVIVVVFVVFVLVRWHGEIDVGIHGVVRGGAIGLFHVARGLCQIERGAAHGFGGWCRQRHL